jgi:hypothetical protein
MLLLLHEGRDLGPLLPREAVERPDEFLAAPDDPRPRLVAGEHGQALLGQGGAQGLRPVAARPCLAHDLAHVPEVHSLPVQHPALIRGDGAARRLGLRPEARRQPCRDLGPGLLEIPDRAPVMPPERRRLAQLELREPAGGLDLDLVEAGPGHRPVRPDPGDYEVKVAAALAGDAGLVVDHAGAAILGHAEMAQHDVAGPVHLRIAHLPAGADADVEEGRIGLRPVPHQLHVAKGGREVRGEHGVDSHGHALVHLRLQEMGAEVPGVAPGPAMRDDVSDHPEDPAAASTAS